MQNNKTPDSWQFCLCRGIFLCDQQIVQCHEDGKECKICGGEIQKIPALDARPFFSDALERDQACHGCNERAKSAEVRADDERGVFLCEARQQERGGHVADDLTGKHSSEHFMSGDHAFEKIAEHGDPAHIADEHEEPDKGQEQRIIDLAQNTAVSEHDSKEHDRKRDAPVDEPRNSQKREREQDQVNDQLSAADGGGLFAEIHGKGGGFLSGIPHAPEHEQDTGNGSVREHEEKEFPKRHSGNAVEVEVLRIADGGEHAAEVRGNGLHDDNGDHVLVLLPLPCQSENDECKRDKGDECNIIGHEHTAEKAEQDEDGNELAHTVHL